MGDFHNIACQKHPQIKTFLYSFYHAKLNFDMAGLKQGIFISRNKQAKSFITIVNKLERKKEVK
jgi:hypothetical protein